LPAEACEQPLARQVFLARKATFFAKFYQKTIIDVYQGAP
jgi:hypothetical protein